MKKAILFILLPLIAVVVCLNCFDVVSALNKTGQDMFVTGRSYNRQENPVKLKKENNRQLKNKIRIKAWDEHAPMDAAVPVVFSPVACCYDRPAYSGFSIHFSETSSSRRNLRGPPVAGC